VSSIDRRPNGRWRARYRDPNGRSRSRTFDRKVDARRFLERTGTAIQRGEWRDTQRQRITFSVWAEQWWASLGSIRESTRITYKTEVERHLLPAWGPVVLGRIDPLAIQQWLSSELDNRTTAAVVKSYRMFRLILRYALQMGVLARDPSGGVRVPRPVQHEMRFLDVGPVEDLAEAVGPFYRALVFVLAYGGLRWGEAAGLRRHNIDLLARQVIIVEQLVELPGGGHRFGPPKSEAGVRRVDPASLRLRRVDNAVGLTLAARRRRARLREYPRRPAPPLHLSAQRLAAGHFHAGPRRIQTARSAPHRRGPRDR
jgi:integrase